MLCNRGGIAPVILESTEGAGGASGVAAGSACHVAGGVGTVTVGGGTARVRAAIGRIGAFGANGAIGANGGILRCGGPLGRLRDRGGCGSRRGGSPCGRGGGHLGGSGSVFAVIVTAGGQHRRGKDKSKGKNTESFHCDPPVVFDSEVVFPHLREIDR